MAKRTRDAGGSGSGRRGGRSSIERSRETNKSIARQMLQSWNDRQETHLPRDLISPALITHFRNRVSTTKEEKAERTRLQVVAPRSGLRGQQFEEQVLIADEEYVFVGWQVTGTQDRTLYDQPATNKTVSATGGDILRIQDGKIVAHWDFYSKARIHLLARLGLLNPKMQKYLVDNDLLGRNRATGRLRPEDLQAWLMV